MTALCICELKELQVLISLHFRLVSHNKERCTQIQKTVNINCHMAEAQQVQIPQQAPEVRSLTPLCQLGHTVYRVILTLPLTDLNNL